MTFLRAVATRTGSKGKSNDVPFEYYLYTIRLHQSSSLYLRLHFIVSLPDVRYFSALVVWEEQEAEDQLYYQKRQLIFKWLLVINSADSGIPNRSSHVLFFNLGNFRET